MHEFVARLKGYSTAAPTGESAVFGSLGNLANALDVRQSRLRIGLWPIISSAEPEVALGISVLLAGLLERWQIIKVYRLIARLDDDPEIYEWHSELSQFGVDDWGLDDLDENVAMWGGLTHTGGQWSLSLEVENDLDASQEDPKVFACAADSLSRLVGSLPGVVTEVAEYLEAGSPRVTLPAWSEASWDEANLRTLLGQVFDWELHLWLLLWGRRWSPDDCLSAQTMLIEAADELDPVEIGVWAAAQCLARGLLPIYEPVGEILLPEVAPTAEFFDYAPAFVMDVARRLFEVRQTQLAYNLLELSVEADSDSIDAWITLGELYWRGGEAAAAINTFQRAIEAEAVSAALYTRYAELLLLLDASNITLNIGARHTLGSGRSFLEQFVLIDPDEVQDNWLIWEAVEALRAALELEPGNIAALNQLNLQLVDLTDESLWSEFERLVAADVEGDRIRGVVDALYMLEDIEPVIMILRDAVRRQPERGDLRLSLAAALLTAEDFEAARTELEHVLAQSGVGSARADVERMMLSVEDPEFEARLGDITDYINSGAELSEEDVEYLETALQQAPHFAALYTLLADGYAGWDEDDDALEVLLDGQKLLPDDPDILAMLARVLWDAGEDQLAFDYLNQGLSSSPNHVPLLALTGRYLFDDGQAESAKTFLLRAEMIDPRHPILNEVRQYIARSMNTS